jgi:hypothetical protein
MRNCSRWIWLAVLLGIIGVAAAVAEQPGGDHVSMGNRIEVDENEDAGDLVCFLCSVRVDGSSEDVVVFGGRAVISGTVKGDLVDIGTGVTLGEDAVVNGDLVAIGGRVSRNPGAVLKGDVSLHPGGTLLVLVLLTPFLPIVLVIAGIIWLVRRNRRPAMARA